MAASLTSTDLTLDNTSGASIPGTPSAGQTVIYPKDDKLLYYKDDAGVERSANINSGTVVATTSGTSIDFTGIPAGVKRVTVMLLGVSTNGSSLVQLQVGSDSVTTSGYNSSGSTNGATTANIGSGLLVQGRASNTNQIRGALTLSLIASNTWVYSGTTQPNPSSNDVYMLAGSTPALAGALDRVRLTTANGTDAFDLGSVNISWEF